jgi:hypothetical protein
MFTGNRMSANGVIANRLLLAMGLAVASMAVVSGCATNDGPGDPPTPSTAVTEQASRVEWCDAEYLDSIGREIGICVLPCNGPLVCSGITSGPDVASTEHSCERCFPRCHLGDCF